MLLCSHCAKACGKRVGSELSLPCDGGGFITNIDGVLTCKRLDRSLPDGTYLGSCSGCAVSNSMLRCESCKDGQGKGGPPTRVDITGCERFGNEFGKLVCILQTAKVEL
jgi:hypothetical protein